MFEVVRVVIKGEMPERCDECQFFESRSVMAGNRIKSHCLIGDYTWGFGYNQERPDWCSLVLDQFPEGDSSITLEK
jgi:hypothetical protein